MISIIVPVYNSAPFLDKCIQSLVDQTYRDIEIIIIDDGSKDDSPTILRKWKDADPRIRVVFKEKNSGVSDSRNIGLQMAKGEYIGFVDSDDWVEPEMYGEMLTQLEKTGADVAFSGYNRIEEGRVVVVQVSKPTGTVLPVDDALLQVMPQRGEGRYNLFLWDKLFRKTAAIMDGEPILFDPAYAYCEDVLWLTQVLLNGKTVVFWQGCGYNYRTNNGANTWTALNSYNSMKHCISAVETNQRMFQLLHEVGSKAENNQLQRILYYQRYAFRTAAKQNNLQSYKLYHNGYILNLLKWYNGNRSAIGLKWLAKQIGSDLCFRLRRLRGKDSNAH